jgi:hypothetical protein
MRIAALVLAIAVVGAGVGLVAVGTAQAHGGDGGGDVGAVTLPNATCLPVEGITGPETCDPARVPSGQ